MPGTATSGEMQQAMNMGCEVVKFFPAEANGGVDKLKNIGAQQHIGQFFVNLLDALFSTCGAEGDLSSRQAAIHQSLAQRNRLVHAVESDNGDDTNFVNALKDRIHNAFSLH